MGVYLNSKKSGAVYKNMVQSLYFVDKTAILGELIPMVEQDPAGTVGIAYDRKDGSKRHECKVEVLRGSLKSS